ncbi:MAG: hypothetical protein ABIF88_03315 [archaeon]
MGDIDVRETILDKKSFFNVKLFSLKNLGKDFFLKTFDSTKSRKNTFEQDKSLRDNRIIFEKSKFIKTFDEIEKLTKETDEKTINNFFGRQAWLDDKFTLFHSTLKFNPYQHIKSIKEIEGFLHYYYSFSKNILLIPNVTTHYTPLDDEGKWVAKNKVQIIALKEYIRLVDELYEFFEQMNNKPLFVPISLKFSIEEIKELIEYSLKKERYYFWIDFESAPADLSNAIIGGKLGQINSLLRSSKYFDKIVVFATNVKREIKSNSKDDRSPSSDVLGMICGANIVGVDRDPVRGFNPKSELEQKKIIEHKSRFFDESTYYYNIKREQKPDICSNVTSNSLKLAEEFNKQREHFLEKGEIENYLKNKEMITTFNGGKILKSLLANGGESQKKLF